MTEDDEIRAKTRLLEEMSIEGLTERIEALKAEISQCEAQIEKKQASRKAAEAAFFKSE